MALVLVTGHLKDNQSTIVQGSVLFQLVNWGGDNPRVFSTNTIVPIVTVANADATGFFTANIQGNDTITPAGTYYQVTYRDALGKPTTIVSYSFTGGTVNLDTLVPLNPPPSPPSPATLDQTYIRIDGGNIGGVAVSKYPRANGNAFASSLIQAGDLPVFIASGASHAQGVVPDPGAIAGTTKFLREDATFVTPSYLIAAEFIIDGSGATITTGSKGFIEIPFAATITGWTILGDQSGSVVVDVKRSTYAGFPTTSSIAGTNLPTLSAVQKNQNLVLSGWGSTAIAAGDVLEFVVSSVTTIQRVTVSLRMTRT